MLLLNHKIQVNPRHITLFYRVNLYKANLNKANLEGANLEKVYLSKASLNGANLERTCLKGANLYLATFNAQTQWPKDFDPIHTKAIFKDWPR